MKTKLKKLGYYISDSPIEENSILGGKRELIDVPFIEQILTHSFQIFKTNFGYKLLIGVLASVEFEFKNENQVIQCIQENILL